MRQIENKIKLLNKTNEWIVFVNKGVCWVYKVGGDDAFGQKEGDFIFTDVSNLNYQSELAIFHNEYKLPVNKAIRPDFSKRIEFKDNGDIFCKVRE